MASLACGVGAAVGGCVALALALPAYALKEILEERYRKNAKRHLKRRSKPKVNFEDLDTPYAPSKMCKVYNQCSPPQYEDLFDKSPSPSPPPYPARR